MQVFAKKNYCKLCFNKEYFTFWFTVDSFYVKVGSLFEEGVRKANSSDSSRWTHTYTASRGNMGARGQFYGQR